MSVYRINKTRLAELVDRTIKYVVEADLKDVTSIRDYAFRGCNELISITIPNSITSIGTAVFYNCSSLTSITIPSGVTSIESYTFYACSSLTSVIFGENSQLTSIEHNAFRDCTGLTSITIPDSVTSIEHNAFNSCSSLTEMTVLATTPPTLTSDSFQSSGITASTGVIYVPSASLSAYQTATNWSVFTSQMVGV